MNAYENGIVLASDSGSPDITQEVLMSGDVWYVNSVTGNNANDGRNRDLPLADVLTADGKAVADTDIVIIESGHVETLVAPIALTKNGVKYYGLGAGTTKPKFIVNANIFGFDLTGLSRVELNNLLFPEALVANTGKICIAGTNHKIINCDFKCGINDTNNIVSTTTTRDPEINGCTFTVTALGPNQAILIFDLNNSGFKIIQSQFDGGLFNFANAAIYSLGAHQNYYYKDNALINKASIIHSVVGANGMCINTQANFGSRIEL